MPEHKLRHVRIGLDHRPYRERILQRPLAAPFRQEERAGTTCTRKRSSNSSAVRGAFAAGASWGPDDRIAFVSGGRSPVHVVDARGGMAEPLTTLQSREVSHTMPELLPDGRTLLFTSGNAIHALDIPSGRRAQLAGGAAPRFVRGHVIFGQATRLVAAPFDASRLTLAGPVVPLLEAVAQDTIGVRHFAIADDGTLAYVSGARAHALVVRNRDGVERLVTQEQLRFENPQFSPDGHHVVVAATRRAGERSEVWIHDLESGTDSRLTFEGGRAPVWTRDGSAITYSHPVVGEQWGIYTKLARAMARTRPRSAPRAPQAGDPRARLAGDVRLRHDARRCDQGNPEGASR